MVDFLHRQKKGASMEDGLMEIIGDSTGSFMNSLLVQQMIQNKVDHYWNCSIGFGLVSVICILITILFFTKCFINHKNNGVSMLSEVDAAIDRNPLYLLVFFCGAIFIMSTVVSFCSWAEWVDRPYDMALKAMLS